MTRIEQIKEALVRLQLPIRLNARTPESVIESYEQWLEEFLGAKSLTGARIADLMGELGDTCNGLHIFDGCRPDCGYEGCTHKRFTVGVAHYDDKSEDGRGPAHMKAADDIDLAIAELWRKVFIDTEEES